MRQPLRQIEMLAYPADLAVANLKETCCRQLIALATGVWQAIISAQVFTAQGEFAGGALPARLGEDLQVIDAFAVTALGALQVIGKGLYALLARTLVDIQQHIGAEKGQAGTAGAVAEGVEIAGKQDVGR